jgi:hypothetical protein
VIDWPKIGKESLLIQRKKIELRKTNDISVVVLSVALIITELLWN